MKMGLTVITAVIFATSAWGQTKSQRKALDEIALATVAGERCPSLSINQALIAAMLSSQRIDLSADMFKTPFNGRLFATRFIFDQDGNARACADAEKNSTLLSRRR